MNESQIQSLQEQAMSAIESAETKDALEEVRVSYIGRKGGALTEILRSLKDLTDDEKRVVGPAANKAKQAVEAAIDARERAIAAGDAGVINDLSLPGIQATRGYYHALTRVRREVLEIFESMGFIVYEGPEMDNDWYNFEALNIPKSHPARDMQDTFFIQTDMSRKEGELGDSRGHESDKWVMRTHTSNTQQRILQEFGTPVRAIVPGRVFRNEATDATHEHTFYQFEAVVVDTDITIGNLTFALQEIFRQLVGPEAKIRLRPGYFPFTEPSYEVDAYMPGVKKGTDWIEMGGSGMIHPNVLKAAGIDPDKYSGFAFGMGWDRLTMMKYGLKDVRLLANADIRLRERF